MGMKWRRFRALAAILVAVAAVGCSGDGGFLFGSKRQWTPTRVELQRSLNPEELNLAMAQEWRRQRERAGEAEVRAPAAGQVKSLDQPASQAGDSGSERKDLRIDLASGQQKLHIDLDTGRAALTDYDGRTYPLVMDARVISQIRVLSRDRAWMVPMPRKVPTAGAPVFYSATLYQDEQRVPYLARWVVPSLEALPELQRTLTNAFEVAHRSAHPLSETVDLLK